MMNPSPYSFLHRLGCAWAGVQYMIRQDRHFRFHLSAFVLVVVAGLLADLEAWAWTAVLGISALVLAAETMNAALETALDRIHPERHPAIGLAKDLAAGAVLIAASLAVVVGLVVFLPHVLRIWDWFTTA